MAAALAQALGVAECVPTAPLPVAPPLSVPQPVPLSAPLPLRVALPLPMPLLLPEGGCEAVSEARGERESEASAVALPQAEAPPETVGERVLLEDALPGRIEGVGLAVLEVVAPRGGDEGVADALPPPPPWRAPAAVALLEAHAVKVVSCEAEAVAEAQREEVREVEGEPEDESAALPRAETVKGPLSVPLAVGLPLRLALREGSCTLPVAHGDGTAVLEDNSAPVCDGGGDGVPLPPVAAAEPLLSPLPPPETVPLRLRKTLLLTLAHPVPPPATVKLAHSEAPPVPVLDSVGDAEAPALDEVLGVSEATLESEASPLCVTADVAVRAKLLLRSALTL